MGRNAVEVENVSKRYRLGQNQAGYATLRETLAGAFRGRRQRRRNAEDLWALKDIDLELGEGEALGIIGRNGAGKSTLLKLLARITDPTIGVVRTRGRLGSLLEVGTGFHPELTGRENVYLNGAILGMTRRDIDQRFDEIVAFSGVERFLDTPIKRYSSGMNLRLAFAVAAHLEPDIMVVDEVLAVGDAQFQRKCVGKMASVEREGRTVLFVSHDLDAITRLCPQVVWLDQGSIKMSGASSSVVDAYLSTGLSTGGPVTFGDDPDAVAVVRSVAVLDRQGASGDMLSRDEPFTVEVRLQTRGHVPALNVAVSLVNLRGVRVMDEAWSDAEPEVDEAPPGTYVCRVTIPPVLAVGQYFLGLWVGSIYDTLVWEPEALTFQLEGNDRGRPERVVHLDATWDVRREDT